MPSIDASILGSGGAWGFVLIAALAFCLGVCVTLLSVKLRNRSREDGYAGTISDDANRASAARDAADDDGSALQ